MRSWISICIVFFTMIIFSCKQASQLTQPQQSQRQMQAKNSEPSKKAISNQEISENVKSQIKQLLQAMTSENYSQRDQATKQLRNLIDTSSGTQESLAK